MEIMVKHSPVKITRGRKYVLFYFPFYCSCQKKEANEEKTLFDKDGPTVMSAGLGDWDKCVQRVRIYMARMSICQVSLPWQV